ncbi:hypothetical protein N3K66_004351 [Trichothecium roseum]|uniref:Uncharacterized protein n=1 Tax=Trichothecium roseum TaxID=47278 RepID=A0ACC0V126_9HYPO|nr:hypothetical protein N3K66_004351 [Trichothecium roseum]
MPAKKACEQKKKALSGRQPDAKINRNVKHQQRLLDCFSSGFSEALSSENLSESLQQIKQALFYRDFAAAFGSEDFLLAYAARWGPTRALCYEAIFESIGEHLSQIISGQGPMGGEEMDEAASDRNRAAPLAEKKRKMKMLSIGGCVAEQAAFASYLYETGQGGSLVLLDMGPWEHPTSLLQEALTTPPKISKYASAAIKAANYPLLYEDQLSLTFTREDALKLGKGRLDEITSGEKTVVTLMFTLNELYTSGGIAKTTNLLTTLGETLVDGSLLLIVDSPGSYSEAAIGKDKKKYPMQWLLDYTLVQKNPEGYTWEKLLSNDSVWFRLGAELSYPMQLEDMRYQIHLYRIHKT